MSLSSFLKSNGTIDLWALPAVPPPPGVQSNFVNPHSLGNSLIIVHSVFLALNLMAVAARFYGKEAYQGQRYDWSDATCLVAFLGSIAHSGLTIYNTTIYYGRHLWDIPALGLTRSHMMDFTAVDIIYVLTTYLIKISLLISYRRLFWVHTRAIRCIYFGFLLVTILSIPHLSVSVVRVQQCAGLEALTHHICRNRTVDTTNIIFGCFAVATDCYILAIPVCLVRTLQMQTKKKIGVLAVFLAGGVACGMSICRVAVVGQEFKNTDALYTAARVSHFSAVEVKLAIICACAPCFPSFFRRSKNSLTTVYTNLSMWRISSTSEEKTKQGSSNSSVAKSSEQHARESLDFTMLSPEIRQV